MVNNTITFKEMVYQEYQFLGLSNTDFDYYFNYIIQEYEKDAINDVDLNTYIINFIDKDIMNSINIDGNIILVLKYIDYYFSKSSNANTNIQALRKFLFNYKIEEKYYPVIVKNSKLLQNVLKQLINVNYKTGKRSIIYKLMHEYAKLNNINCKYLELPKNEYDKKFKELIDEIKNGNKKAQKDFIELNSFLVINCAQKFMSMYENASYEDLLQTGYLALIQVAPRIKITQKKTCSNMICEYIEKAMLQELSKNNLLSASRKTLDMYQEIKNTEIEMNNKLGRKVSIYELAMALSISPFEIQKIYSAFLPKVSLNSDRIENLDRYIDMNHYLEKVDDQIYIETIIENAKLSLKNKQIIKYILGYENGDSHSLEETGKHFNITRARVDQIVDKFIEQVNSSASLKTLKEVKPENMISVHDYTNNNLLALYNCSQELFNNALLFLTNDEFDILIKGLTQEEITLKEYQLFKNIIKNILPYIINNLKNQKTIWRNIEKKDVFETELLEEKIIFNEENIPDVNDIDIKTLNRRAVKMFSNPRFRFLLNTYDYKYLIAAFLYLFYDYNIKMLASYLNLDVLDLIYNLRDIGKDLSGKEEEQIIKKLNITK